MRRYTILRVPVLSFFSKALYREVALRWKGSGLAYLLLLTAICSIPSTIRPYFDVCSNANKIPQLIEQFPEITFLHGEASIDEPQPYYIKDPLTGQPAAIIDTTGKINSLGGTGAKLLLTKTHWVSRNDLTETRTPHPWTEKKITVSGAMLRAVLDGVPVVLSKFIFLLVVCPFLLLSPFLLAAAEALIYAAIAMFIRLRYASRQSYLSFLRLAVVAVTPSTIVLAILVAANVHLSTVRYLHFAVDLAYLIFGVKAASQVIQSPTAASDESKEEALTVITPPLGSFPKLCSHWLGWLASGLVLVLLVMPATSWVVTQQFRMQFDPPRPLEFLVQDLGVKYQPVAVDFSSESHLLTRTAEKHPTDYQLQLTATIAIASPVPTAERLRTLIPRFAERPSLYAHILRYACSDVRAHREEDFLLSGQASSSSGFSFPELPTPTSQHLTAFEQAAREGERLDPDNAYFSLMRAVGLIAAHRDTEALAAVRLAAKKPRWYDYTAEETHGQWRLRRQAFGERSAIPRAILQASNLFPHFGRLRAIARVATYKAVEKERAGHVEEGLAIRHALMKCGSLMRVQSSSAFGSVTGIAMTNTALTRPGGGPPVQRPAEMSAEKWQQKRADDYVAYLEHVGFRDEADWVKAEVAAGRKARSIVPRDVSDIGWANFSELIAGWASGIIVLCNALWLLCMGASAAFLERRGAKRGIAFLLLALGWLLLAVWTVSLARSCELLYVLWAVLQSLQGVTSGLLAPAVVRILSIPATLVLPAILTICALIAALIRRAPILRLVRAAIQVSCILLLVYGGLVLYTLQQEIYIHGRIERGLRHEGRLYAELAGQQWPGPVH